MKIVYLVERIDVFGGIERSLTVRANYLVEKYGYEITIVCTEKDTGIPAYPLNDKIKLIFLEDFKKHKSIFKRISLRFKQSKRILNMKPNIIISTKYTLHNLFFKLLRTEAKLISELRETKENYNLNRNKSIKNRINFFIRDSIFRKQDVLITLTNKAKDDWGYNNIHVVPNPQTIQTNKKSNLSNKQVLAIGRLEKVKGFDKLIEVWNIVNKTHPDWTLKICGQGSQYQELKKRINFLKLNKSIILQNKFEDVLPLYLNSSIFVLTSQFESFGNVLVEAKTCGVPIVSFNAPNGPIEIIEHGIDGIIIEQDNIELMASKINLLIENPSLRKKMGVFAKLNSLKYNIDNVMESYNQIITF